VRRLPIVAEWRIQSPSHRLREPVVRVHLRFDDGDASTSRPVAGLVVFTILDEFNEALCDVVEQQPQEVVVDLAHTTFIDSLTLGSLTAAGKRVRAATFFGVVRASAGGPARVRDHRLGQVLLAEAN
jgi:hypothetical protein